MDRITTNHPDTIHLPIQLLYRLVIALSLSLASAKLKFCSRSLHQTPATMKYFKTKTRNLLSLENNFPIRRSFTTKSRFSFDYYHSCLYLLKKTEELYCSFETVFCNKVWIGSILKTTERIAFKLHDQTEVKWYSALVKQGMKCTRPSPISFWLFRK